MSPNKPPPHKDRHGDPCRSDAQYARGGGETKRRCLGCGRLESYEPDSLIVIFKKGAKAMDAIAYLAQFKLNGRQPKTGGKAEKDGIVALFVSIPLAANETLEDWAKALEEPPAGRTTPVWFASRVLKVDFEAAPGWR